MIEQRTLHEDGCLTAIDPERGIGLICDALVPARRLRGNPWRVISLFPYIDKPDPAYFITDYGRN